MYKKNRLNFKMISILSLLILNLFFLGFNVENYKNNKIYKNIKIENTDIGGLTQNDALIKLKREYKPKNIIFTYKDKIWILVPNQICLKYNIEEMVNKAYYYTRSNNKLDNLNRILNLQSGKLYTLRLNSSYDENKLSIFINDICKEIDKSSYESSVEINELSEIKITNSQTGIEVDRVKLKEMIYYHIKDKKYNSKIIIPVEITYPQISSEKLATINCVLGQYSTFFNENTSRATNIHIASETTSDFLLMPQESFSYNKLTGARNWSKGYKRAKVIVGGKYIYGEGGGVCQVSSTIYNAALLAGLKIEEVHNHTYPSKYAPKGRDSAVSYGYTDLKIKNTFMHPVYIKNIIKNGTLTCKIYGSSVDRQKLYINTDEKRDNKYIYVNTYRVFLDEEGNSISKELINKNKYNIK